MSGGPSAQRIANAALVLAGSYAAVVIGFRALGTPRQVATMALGYAGAILGVAAFVGVLAWGRALVRCHRAGVHPPAVALALTAVRTRWQADRAASVWQPLLAFVLVMTAFSLFKQTALPTAGFVMGPAIADAERALFGADSWRVAHALLPSPWATQAIDLAYHAWFAPMTLGVALCAFARPGHPLAERYLLGFVLLWVVQGSLLAYWFPAAGPAFFAQFQVESGRFAALTQRLAEQDHWLRAAGAPGLSALVYQDYLLHLFVERKVAIGGGIAAMPSLHNAMAVLFACAARHISPRLGWAAAGYAVVIWVGSIQLGWHYALDGVVALAATMATWKATGVICAALRRPEPVVLPAPVSA